jgi:hypothetical protein
VFAMLGYRQKRVKLSVPLSSPILYTG